MIYTYIPKSFSNYASPLIQEGYHEVDHWWWQKLVVLKRRSNRYLVLFRGDAINQMVTTLIKIYLPFSSIVITQIYLNNKRYLCNTIYIRKILKLFGSYDQKMKNEKKKEKKNILQKLLE